VRYDGQRQHEGDRSRQDPHTGHRDALRSPSVGHHRPAIPSARRVEVRQLRIAPGRVWTAVCRRAGTRHAPGGRRRLTRRPDVLGSTRPPNAAATASTDGHGLGLRSAHVLGWGGLGLNSHLLRGLSGRVSLSCGKLTHEPKKTGEHNCFIAIGQ